MDLALSIEKLLVGRWIAGGTVEDAIALAKKLNESNIIAMVNCLGENLSAEKEVNAAVHEYEKLIRSARVSKTKISISLKPTQLGSLISTRLLEKNYSHITKLARANNIFVWLDMEEYKYIDKTISLYKKELHKGGVGICIQAYLRRSKKDIAMLSKRRAIIRLVKGAYKEGPLCAYQTRKQITLNYRRLMYYLLYSAAAKTFTIATHDKTIIEEALALNKRYKKNIRFAMLNGINNKYARELAKGNDMSLYVPFGRQWLPYSYRRLREMSNIILIIKSLFH